MDSTNVKFMKTDNSPTWGYKSASTKAMKWVAVAVEIKNASFDETGHKAPYIM